MDSTEQLIRDFYAAAIAGDWQAYRAQALGRVCEALGAVSAAWLTYGSDGDSGELTERSAPRVSAAALAGLTFEDTGLLTLPTQDGVRTMVFGYPHRNAPIQSRVLLRFPAEHAAPAADFLHRLLMHMIEAGALAIAQFMHRDDWLAAMGRSNRGAAAMVDARGTLFSTSERFREVIDCDSSSGRLPFDLPEAVLCADGGSFLHGLRHVRVRSVGTLYLLYVRPPLPLDSLSPREQEIARALGSGKTLKSIARQYGIAVSTVANHTTRIYRKLEIYRREDLIDLVRMKPDPRRRSELAG